MAPLLVAYRAVSWAQTRSGNTSLRALLRVVEGWSVCVQKDGSAREVRYVRPSKVCLPGNGSRARGHDKNADLVKGPIVRINPWELHVSHPDFYEELYAKVGRRRDKFQYHAAQFGNPESAFGTVSHDLHRLRTYSPIRVALHAGCTKKPH
jgi:hypothetical protein